MKFLTLELIKQQCRIEQDFEDEDKILTLYGKSAENTMFNYIGRSYEEVMEIYGEVPAPLVEATLMMVDKSYQHRSPASPQNMYYVLYGFDTLVKPYMRLADNNYEPTNNSYGCKHL